MPVASLAPRQGGFSLLEVLCALALFAVVMAALLWGITACCSRVLPANGS